MDRRGRVKVKLIERIDPFDIMDEVARNQTNIDMEAFFKLESDLQIVNGLSDYTRPIVRRDANKKRYVVKENGIELLCQSNS